MILFASGVLSVTSLGISAYLILGAGEIVSRMDTAIFTTVVGLLSAAVTALWFEEKKNKKLIMRELNECKNDRKNLNADNTIIMSELSVILSVMTNIQLTGNSCATANKVLGGCPASGAIEPLTHHAKRLESSLTRLQNRIAQKAMENLEG